MIAESKIMWTTIVVWTITIPIYWVDILVLAVLLYLFMQIIDVVTWYIAARKKKAIASWIIREWLVSKFILILWIMLALAITLFLSTVLKENSVTVLGVNVAYLVAIFPLVTTILFIYMEFLSILENFSVILKWSRQGKLFSVISFLWNKLFNVSIETLNETAEKKIESKFKNNFK